MLLSLLNIGAGCSFTCSYHSSLELTRQPERHTNQDFAPTAPPHLSFCHYMDKNKESICQSRSSLVRLILCRIWQQNESPSAPGQLGSMGQHSYAQRDLKQLDWHLYLSATAGAVWCWMHCAYRCGADSLGGILEEERQSSEPAYPSALLDHSG